MKKNYLPPVKMLQEAKDNSKGHKLWIEIAIFLLVFGLTQSIAAIPVTIGSVIAIFTSDTFQEMLSQIASGGLMSDAEIMDMTNTLLANMPDWLMLVQLFATALATGGVIIYCRFIEKRPISSMGLRKGHILREYGIGAGVGILLISLCVGLCLLTGSMQLQASAFSPVMWLLFLMGFVIQGMSEEVMCRGYMMVSVSRKNALWLAVMTNSVIFSLLHLGNPGFGLLPLVNIILFGILESVYVLKRGDLWGACAIHSLWNFFQGNVFGISVSGTGAGSSPLSAVMTEGHELLNGGSFGLEGGIAVTLVIGIATVAMLLFLPSNKEELQPAVAIEEM